MKKKILALVLVLALVASVAVALVACDETPADTTVSFSPIAKEDIKFGLICLHGENSTYDKNFIDAFKAACDEMGVEYVISTDIPEDATCYDEAVSLVNQGCNIIFADSFGHESYILQAAKEYPNVRFAHATGTTAHTELAANFYNAFASIYEGRYLAGIVAGYELLRLYDGDKDGAITDAEAKIGYVGAFPYAEVVSGYTSFFLGVRSVVENATMEVTYTGSWYDETAEGAAAQALIKRGAKLISQHADSMGAPTLARPRKSPMSLTTSPPQQTAPIPMSRAPRSTGLPTSSTSSSAPSTVSPLSVSTGPVISPPTPCRSLISARMFPRKQKKQSQRQRQHSSPAPSRSSIAPPSPWTARP